MAGTPVAGGLFDVAASAIGSGGAAAGYLSLVAGTWSIATVVTREPLIDRSLLMTTAFADAERWMAIEASATSAANLNWFASEAFVDDGPEAGDGIGVRPLLQRRRIGRPPGVEPHLPPLPLRLARRTRAPGRASTASRRATPAPILPAPSWRESRSAIGRTSPTSSAAGATPRRVRLTGGGARSGFWSQMFADVLGMPIEIPDAEETGARGAALAAGVAIGAYRDLDEAMDRATRVARGLPARPGARCGL